MRSLDLKSNIEWRNYCKVGRKPADIPSNPDHVYLDDGWAGWGVWLGTGRIAHGARKYQSFEKARAFARTLGFKNQNEWFEFSRSGRKPEDIPAGPQRIYAKDGWTGWGDWLGTGNVANSMRRHRPFEEARSFVRRLGLKSIKEWEAYCKSGDRPIDIPTNPNRAYVQSGWAGMSDWLGTGRKSPTLPWRPFKDARTYARGLELKFATDWTAYCKSGKKPNDIPSNPQQTYVQSGWAGMSDWLGTGKVAPGRHRSFKKARAFARDLGLKSGAEWIKYCKSGKKPADIPNAPQSVYLNDGWSGIDDWLGTEKLRPGQHRSFKKARAVQPMRWPQ